MNLKLMPIHSQTELAVKRVASENIATADYLDKIHKKKIYNGIFNPNTLAVGWIFLLDNITVQGLAFFLPTIVRTIYPTKTVIEQQLYTVPPYVVGATGKTNVLSYRNLF